MHHIPPFYYLAGASLAATFVVTILDGACYASSTPSSSNIPSIEAAIVSLSALSCCALAILIVLWGTDIHQSVARQWKSWRAIAHGLVIVYLALATAIIAAGIAWSAVQLKDGSERATQPSSRQSLMIARCVVWVLSVLIQGLLCGHLITASRKERRHRWSTSVFQEPGEMTDQFSTEGDVSKTPPLADGSQQGLEHSEKPCDGFAPIQGSTASSAASQSSKRYSGRTLYQPDSKRNSFDNSLAKSIYSNCSTFNDEVEHHTTNTMNERARPKSVPHKNSPIKKSLDSARRASAVLPARSSTTTVEAPSRSVPPRLKLADESNIHPLFRSDSSSPPPTPTPGTIVIACPSAGQTISVQTLSRARSNHSGSRNMARYERKQALSESPLES